MKTSKTRPTIYFVEGECEQKLISELKKEPALMVPGKALGVFSRLESKGIEDIIIT